jgi:hypothetical protein
MRESMKLNGLVISLGLLLAGNAASACASMQYSHVGEGTNIGAYYFLTNDCPYNVFFRFVAGVDGTGVNGTRPYNVFWAAGRSATMFIYGPLPTSYSVVQQ